MTEGDELVVDFEDEQRATSVSCVSSDWSTDSLCASEASEATANFSVSNSSSLSAALRLARAFCTRCDHDIMDGSLDTNALARVSPLGGAADDDTALAVGIRHAYVA